MALNGLYCADVPLSYSLTHAQSALSSIRRRYAAVRAEWPFDRMMMRPLSQSRCVLKTSLDGFWKKGFFSIQPKRKQFYLARMSSAKRLQQQVALALQGQYSAVSRHSQASWCHAMHFGYGEILETNYKKILRLSYDVIITYDNRKSNLR